MSTQSVTTAIRVLECVSENQPIGLSALARQLGQSKATLLRMLASLAELGWVEQEPAPTSGWSLTFHAYAIGSKGGAGPSLRELSLGPMSDLQLDTTETIHLCVPDGGQLVVVERLDTSHVLRAFIAIGTRIPLHASGTGLAYLAASNDAFIEEYLSGPLEARTVRTRTGHDEVWREIGAIRKHGFAVNEGGLTSGITSLGAAIISGSGTPLGSVSISGPAGRITPEKFAEFGDAVASTAAEISGRSVGRR